MPPTPIRRNIEGFWQAEAFARCDLKKGGQMPDFLCFSDGRPMSMATCRVINEARNDVMHSWYNGGPGTINNPYAYGCVSAQLYADVARMAIGEDRSPYKVKG
jgi:hypothetical protein